MASCPAAFLGVVGGLRVAVFWMCAANLAIPGWALSGLRGATALPSRPLVAPDWCMALFGRENRGDARRLDANGVVESMDVLTGLEPTSGVPQRDPAAPHQADHPAGPDRRRCLRWSTWRGRP
jgi:hypothetical protein